MNTIMTDLPRDRTLISTHEAAEILGVTMGRLRQLAMLPEDEGGLWSHHVTPRALVFDKAQILKRSKTKAKTGRPKGGFKAC